MSQSRVDGGCLTARRLPRKSGNSRPTGEPLTVSHSLLQPDRILLLDAFFLVVVFLGSTVDAWQRAGYHENPEHADFRQVSNKQINDNTDNSS